MNGGSPRGRDLGRADAPFDSQRVLLRLAPGGVPTLANPQAPGGPAIG
jgi:hypothetical protein